VAEQELNQNILLMSRASAGFGTARFAGSSLTHL